MKIHSIPVPKTKLDKIPELDCAFYFHMGHLRNEVMVLMKLLDWSSNTATDNPILTDVRVSQTFILSAVLAGKLWEGWELTRKAFFATKLSLSVGNGLPDKAKLSLDRLKKYFGKKNLIHDVRNAFAFHYNLDAVRTQLSAVKETDNLRIYAAEKSANMFYQMSEIIVGSAMLEAIEPGDFLAATRRFTKEVMNVSLRFIDFCDGCLIHMSDHYLGVTSEELNAEEIELPETPNRSECQLPFFAS